MTVNEDPISTPLISLDDDDEFEVQCIMAIIRHADRTCKQKLSLKFSGEVPTEFPIDEDIRAPAELARLPVLLESRRSDCRSDESVIRSGLRTLRSGREDLKVKLEPSEPSGWILKLKWGGNLTALGLQQAEQAGAFFSHHLLPEMDVRAFASGDTRCQETASAFMKGLVKDPSFFVRSGDGPDGLGNLDDTPFRHSPLAKNLRAEISRRLMSGRRIDARFVSELFPERGSLALESVRAEFGSFVAAVVRLKDLIDDFAHSLEAAFATSGASDEALGLVVQRWRVIHKAVHRGDAVSSSPNARWRLQQTASGVPLASLQVSLIGEIFDNAQFDHRHSLALLDASSLSILGEIRSLVTTLAQVVVPLEYGISKQDKSYIGSTFLHPLIRKMRFDFRLAANLPLGDEEVFVDKQSEGRGGPPRLRLYFAHHSHVFSFLSILQSVELFARTAAIAQVASLGYLCELVVSVAKQRRGSKWKFAIDIFSGDAFDTDGANLDFHTVRVVEGVVDSAEEIDQIFSAVLAIPARDGNLPPHLQLPPIGEASADTLPDLDSFTPSELL